MDYLQNPLPSAQTVTLSRRLEKCFQIILKEELKNLLRWKYQVSYSGWRVTKEESFPHGGTLQAVWRREKRWVNLKTISAALLPQDS